MSFANKKLSEANKHPFKKIYFLKVALENKTESLPSIGTVELPGITTAVNIK